MQQQVVQEEDAESVSGSGVAGSYAIYMEDEEVWTGVDIDDDSTVDRQLYAVMIAFLRDYFCPIEQKPNDNKTAQIKSTERKLSGAAEDKKPGSSLIDDLAAGHSSELRMIPGGRYGCTQFLKICGPEAIQRCSVGKTT